MIDLDAIKSRCEAAMQKSIPGYRGYEADSNGDIWSVESNWRGYGPRRLKQHITSDGYMQVRLYRNGRRITKQVHVLIALAFHGLPSQDQETRHLDGSRTCNVPENLAWGSRKDNAADREAHGRTARGSKNGFAKLTEQQVVEIRKLLTGELSQRKIGKIFGVSQRAIGRISRRETWQHVA